MNRFFELQVVRAANLPVALLVLLLQRTPLLKVLVSAEMPASSLVSQILRSAIVGTATLGAFHSVSAATELVTNPTSNEVTPLPAEVGVSFAFAFSVIGAQVPAGSYSVDPSELPPGLTLIGSTGGILNNSSGVIGGIPTQAGTYNFTLNAWQLADASGDQIVYPRIITVTDVASQPPDITYHPVSLTVKPGGGAFFTVKVNGTGVVTYQWKVNGVDLPGETEPTLNLSDVQLADAGSYSVVVTNSAGSTASNGASLAVDANFTSRLFGISTRAKVGSGADVMIGGVAIDGINAAAAKTVLIRAVGPQLALSTPPVPGVLLDPQITLYSGPNPIFSNDDWGDALNLADLVNAVSTVGLSAFASGSKDSTLLETLQRGGYTAILSGVGNTEGVALVEIYDAPPPTVATTKLLGISTRAKVGKGADVMIGGVAIDGSSANAAKTVLIRAVGPQLALSTPPVPGFLVDPQITLYSGATPIFSNDNWGDAPNLSDVVAAMAKIGLGAFASGSKDSVMLVTLKKGGYTAILSGVGNTEGVALVEIYEVPPEE
jgi:hypothetical protein